MVTFNGRITLPSHVLKELGLKTGDSVDFVEIEKGRFAITPGASTLSEPKGWLPKLGFDPTAEEPRFLEMEEATR
jgi:AbrB family looped-hinge helix DNA binding protein